MQILNRDRICETKDCIFPVHARNLCKRHYWTAYHRKEREAKKRFDPPLPPNFHEILRIRRIVCGLKIKTVARLAGICSASLIDYESGKGKPRKYATYKAVIEVLDQFKESSGPRLVAEWINEGKPQPE